MSADHRNAEKELKDPERKRILRLVLFVALLFLLFWLFREPPVRSQPAAPRTISLNNLKNLDLAQMNHAKQSDGLFAVPTLYNADGLPVHGWFTQLLPMLDNTPIYDRMDLSVPWNDPVNQELSRLKLEVALNPGLDEEENDDGYPLLHYTLNTRIFPHNESLAKKHIADADGRAITISNDIDPDVLKALSTPDGGEEVPEDY